MLSVLFVPQFIVSYHLENKHIVIIIIIIHFSFDMTPYAIKIHNKIEFFIGALSY